jgi:Spy/CpxP family protein refolding chaperone
MSSDVVRRTAISLKLGRRKNDSALQLWGRLVRHTGEARARTRALPTMPLRKLMLLVSLAIYAIPAIALAQPFPPGGAIGGPLPMPLLMIVKRTNLTPAQQTKVHELLHSSFVQAQPLMKQLHAVHEQIADKLMSPGSVSASDLEPLQQQEGQIHQLLDEQMLSTAMQIRNLLTPEQLAKAAELHNQMKSLNQQMEALMGDTEPPMGLPPGP